MSSARTSIPASAAILGFAGLIPFLAPPIILLMTGPTSLFAIKLVQVNQTYGAIILSFMGAIHWGLEMADNPDNPSWNNLSTAVSPALLAFFCLQMDQPQQSLWLLAGGFAMLWVYDWTRRNNSPSMPRWYLTLRTPLTLGAILGLVGTSLL